MKKTLLAIAIISLSVSLNAQKKTTSSATISFDASTSLDNLPKADNKTVVGVLDTKSGDIAFEATMKNFSFANPMMQEHFNSEGWMNSDQFPTATFKGSVKNISAVNFSKDGTYTAKVEGTLSLHGVTKPVSSDATVIVKAGTISTSADFTILLSDYNVSGKAIDAGKVSKETKIAVKADF